MKTAIAINGFGRIGRLVLRAALQKNIPVAAINDLSEPEHLAYLLRYDTVHGKFPEKIQVENNCLVIGSQKIQIFSEKDPRRLSWKNLCVVESTGLFTKQEDAEKHLQAGAKIVVISAPTKSASIPTVVMGVNHTQLDPKKDRIISNASCTTNCLAPLTKVLLDSFGIEEGLMTTIHSVTATQSVVDGVSKKDWRGGRAACHNIIPASTGAAKAVGLCLPEVKGKLTGMAMRVPTLDVSAVDLVVKLASSTTYEGICEEMQKASQGSLKGILQYTEDDIVSSDIMGSSYSCVFDKKAGIALNDRFYKLIAWYDNEWGYALRIVDLIEYIESKDC